MLNIEDLKNNKVLLRVDLGSTNHKGYALWGAVESLKLLLKNNNGVCVVSTFGPAFLKPGLTCKPFIHFFTKHLGLDVIWVEDIESIDIKKGKVYLLENTLLDQRELMCDINYINLFKSIFDVMVLDTIVNIDANFATSQGLLREKMPCVYGCGLMKLIALRDLLWRSKVGLVLGGDNVSCQLRFITTMIRQIRFIAVGGEVGLLMMGKGKTIFGHVKKQLMSAMALLRQHKVKILYPMDVVAYSPEIQRNRLALYQDLDKSEEVFDLGRHTIDRILSEIDASDLEVVIVSGTIGHVLDPRYSRGSEALSKGIAERKVKKVVIGKQAVMIVNRLSLSDKYDYMLEEDTMNVRFLTQPKSMEDYIGEIVWNVGAVLEGVV